MLEGMAEWRDRWQVPNACAAVIGPDGVLETFGDLDREYYLASVTKLLTAYAALIAVEEEAFGLDDAAGPPGATVRHLLSHTSGYGFDDEAGIVAAPGTRRVYSNPGIEQFARYATTATGIEFGDYLAEAVFEPLGLKATTLRGSPAHQLYSTTADLARFAAELLRPALLDSSTLAEAVSVQFPGLSGVLPGLGRFDPLDWGLGFERNFGRPRHWAGQLISASAFGHFGAAGTFVWVDPKRARACICLSDRDFGDWAKQAWPALTDAVLAP